MGNPEENKGEIQVYELGYLILSSIPEDKVSSVVTSMKKVIASEGGEEIASEAPFKQSLAYQMSKTIGASRYLADDAYIGWIKFEAEPQNVLTINTALSKIDEILRFLLIKAPRETAFTFAKAKAKMEEKESDKEAALTPNGPVGEAVVQ